MPYEHLILEKNDGIATVTLNAPDKMNALTIEMRKSLIQIRGELTDDDDIRVVIVTGAGRGFCSGADMVGRTGGDVLPSRRERLMPIGPGYGSDTFFTIDKPVIAAINGACAGAGLSLALSMDIRIAAENARFGAVFVRRGLVPDCGITHWLPSTIGMSKAFEMMYTGDLIDAAEAERVGLVSRVVPADELMNTANELAAKIAAQPPMSVELSKRMLYRSVVDKVNQQIEMETRGNRITAASEDSAEAIRAFLEKRPPKRFVGR